MIKLEIKHKARVGVCVCECSAAGVLIKHQQAGEVTSAVKISNENKTARSSGGGRVRGKLSFRCSHSSVGTCR